MDQIPIAVKKKQSTQVVEFRNNYKSKTKSANDSQALDKKQHKIKIIHDKPAADELDEQKTVSLKQAKFDVFKFGIKGFEKQQQENANIQLAVRLGAAPPKNKCVNYKELLQLKKEEKELKEKSLKENNLFAAKIKGSSSSKLANLTRRPKKISANSRKKTKISKGNVGDLKGHIGSFSDGVLKIRKHDLKKMNKK